MAKTIVITQSNYLPWRGYFDLLRSADEVVLLDSVQYTRRDWRNRNRIKTAAGVSWITVPVEVKGRYTQSIDETRIVDRGWGDAHRRSIEAAYRRAPFFLEDGGWLLDLLGGAARHSLLSDVNEELLRAICKRLAVKPEIHRCVEIVDRETLNALSASERLAKLAARRGAQSYLSGPAAKAYLDLEPFEKRGIEVAWMSYDGYPEYEQLWGAFEPGVSIVDALLNLGPDARLCLDKSGPSRVRQAAGIIS